MEQLISIAIVRRAEKRLEEVHVRRGYSSKVSLMKGCCSAPTGRLPSVSRGYVQLGWVECRKNDVIVVINCEHFYNTGCG